MLKILAVAVAGLVTVMMLKRVMEALQAQQAQKVRARATQNSQPRPVTWLRQDPRTGVYHPET
jgi:cellobiose-specific phosphotransferase system component IIB